MYMNKTVPIRSKRNSIISFKKEMEILEDTDEIPFKNLLMFLSFIGALPVTRKAPHYPSLHPTKSTLALAATVFTFNLTSCYSMLTFYADRLMSREFALHEKLMHAQCVVISASAFITVAVWSDTPAIRRGILIWQRMSRLYLKITYRVLKPRWCTLETVIVVITAFFPPVIFFLGKMAVPELGMRYSFAPACLHPLVVIFLVCALWIGNFVYLKGLAEDINKDLSWNIKRRLLNTDKLICYHEIWLQMRALTDCLSTLTAPVVVFMIAVESNILFIYVFIVFMKMEKYLATIPYLMLTASFTVMITLMVKAGHAATEKVKLLHSGILAQHNYDITEGASRRQAIYMYLVERTRSSTPSLGNFVVINKALLTSIFGTVAMHLVVLAQLTQSNKNHTQQSSISGID